MNAFDGSKRKVYARGIRNSVGLEFNPKNNELWFTDNQTDGMGWYASLKISVSE